MENTPPAATAPEKSLPLTVRVTVSPTLNTPLTVPVTGIAAAVDSALLTMPSPTIPASSLILIAGPLASIVSATLAVVLLPAGSVSTTWACPVVPSGSAVVGVTFQVPSLPTVVVSTSPVPGIVTLTVSPTSPVPMMFGLVLLVMPSPLTPLSVVGSSWAVTGGALLSIVSATLAVLELPSKSVSTTCATPLVPSANGVVGVTVQVLFGPTVVVSTSPVPGIVTEILSPATPVPMMLGVGLLVMPSPKTPVSEFGSSCAVKESALVKFRL